MRASWRADPLATAATVLAVLCLAALLGAPLLLMLVETVWHEGALDLRPWGAILSTSADWVQLGLHGGMKHLAHVLGRL